MTTSQNSQQIFSDEQLRIVQEEIVLARNNAKPAVELAEAVERLLKNADFKAVVSEAYFNKELNQVALGISMNNNKDLIERDVSRLKGIHFFREFLNKLLKEGKAGRDYLAYSDEELVELYAERYEVAGE